MVDLKEIRTAIIALCDGYKGRIDEDWLAIIENPEYDGNPLKGDDPYIVIDLKELVPPPSNKLLAIREETADWEVYADGDYPLIKALGYDPD